MVILLALAITILTIAILAYLKQSYKEWEKRCEEKYLNSLNNNYDDCYNFLMNSALDSKDYEWVKEIKEMKN